MQSALRDDALSIAGDQVVVRVGLPWIRSLPLACTSGFTVTVDGEPLTDLQIGLGDRVLEVEDLRDEDGWWYIQDRLALIGRRTLAPGAHTVEVAFMAMIPYLLAGPDGGALTLPLRVARVLETDHAVVPSVSRAVA
ncbi:hypothetical protein [Naasia lichenicola]|uniref:Uncharacterized protein n=1 Tax=Naasia lichenicola TaxID=2565933 RepID=A0A4V3WTF7_9MICO|nr:hypothetical protein [Naasia lichenicola]THG31637.1 hypothetical protein E6C64_06085 [Naasia lichenicola]